MRSELRTELRSKFKGLPGRFNVAAVRAAMTDRRTVLTQVSIFLMISAGFALPVAIAFAALDAFLPLMACVLLFGGASAALTQSLKRRGDRAIPMHMAVMLGVGALFAFQSPGFADFGFAIALMAPVYGTVFSTGFTRLWGGIAAAGLIGFASTWIPAEDFSKANEAASGGAVPAFILFVAITLFAAMRMRRHSMQMERQYVATYSQLAEHVQDAVVRFSADGQVEFITESTQKLFGCPRHQLSREGLEERVHLLDRPAYLKALSDARHGGSEQRVDVRMRRDDPTGESAEATYFWIEVALTPNTQEPQGPNGCEVIAFLRDVTRRHETEREMVRARREAEDASNAKSRFLATVGHELRTPLNAIVGFSEIMAASPHGDIANQHREYSQMINHSGLHLLSIVNMLLDASRIEAGKFELSLEQFDPAKLMEPCLQMVDQLAAEKQVKVVTKIAPEMPPVLGDERAVRQIMINLLSNAIKFSNPGGEVRVGLRRRGVSLVLTVADDGIGMSAEVSDKLGEPFFQAETGNARTYEGAGLGFSIVSGLVELHQGTWNVFSEPGRGTKVTVSLPIAGPRARDEDKELTLVSFGKDQSVEKWQEKKSANS